MIIAGREQLLKTKSKSITTISFKMPKTTFDSGHYIFQLC